MLDEWGEHGRGGRPGASGARPRMELGPEGGDEVRVVGTSDAPGRSRRSATGRAPPGRARHGASDAHARPAARDRRSSSTLIVKTDVRGSLEAVTSELGKLDVGGISVNVLRSRGRRDHRERRRSSRRHRAPSSSASTSVPMRTLARLPNATASRSAHTAIIYELIEDIEKALQGHARARVPRAGARPGRGARDVQDPARASSPVAWSRTARSAGTRRRGSSATAPSSTKARSRRCATSTRTRREIAQGTECGITLENFNDVKVGDIIEAFETVEVAPAA